MTTPAHFESLQQRLQERLPDQPWLEVLQICRITGAADSRQIQTYLDLTPKARRRILEVFAQSGAGLPPVMETFPDPVPRPGLRGRPPTVYRLGESGARLLKLAGTPDARPSGLHDPVAIAHALAMTDLHLAAQRDGLELRTDRPLSFGEGRTVRFDHQLLADGQVLCFEVEQQAAPKRIGRLVKSLENRWDFFHSEAAQDFHSQVRLLFNLPRGKKYRRSLELWAQALGMVQAERGAQPPFSLLAMPLDEFLEQPDWQAQIDERWDPVTPLDPAQRARQSALAPQTFGTEEQLQADLRYLQTVAWNLRANPPEEACLAYPQDFLRLLTLIYQPVEEWNKNNLHDMRPPYSGVAMLRAYLNRRSDLRERLLAQMRKQRQRKWWPEDAVLRHMQRVIETFLDYHGWYNDGFFRITAAKCPPAHPQYPYEVKVSAFPSLRQYCQYYHLDLPTEPKPALSWTLWALFAFGGEIGLIQPAYW